MTSAAKKRRSTVIVKLPEKRESIREKLRRHLRVVAPYFLHLGIVFAVTVYVLVGAYAIQRIERIPPEGSIGETTTNGPETSRLRRDIESTADRSRKQSMTRTRKCVMTELRKLRIKSNCSEAAIEKLDTSSLDDCYEKDGKKILYENQDTTNQVAPKNPLTDKLVLLSDGSWEWRWMDAVIFCFTVITTIGYGNVAPRTFEGRLFVIFYGLIGVPFTMLAIANLGKFLAALLKSWTRPFIKCFGRIHRRCFRRGYTMKEKQRLMDGGKKTKLESNDEEEEEEEEEPEEDTGESSSDAFVLFVSFVLYVIMGSFVISRYEERMTFFEAIYFNFVTLTTIGLGDLVPESERFLLATLIYCAVGLALTTIAIEIAADYLKKLHYFGRKIENVGHVKVWFGGQQISMRQLVKNLGDQFNVPVEQLQGLNLEQFVDDAMRVEAGELATLRTEPQPFESSNYWRAIEGSMLHFVDDDDVIAAQAAQNLRRSISWSVESPSVLRNSSPHPARATSARLNPAASPPRHIAKPNPPMNLDEALMGSLKRELARRKRANKLSSIEDDSDVSEWEWTRRRRRLQSVATARRATGASAGGVEGKDETSVELGQRGGGRQSVQSSSKNEVGGVPHRMATIPDDTGRNASREKGDEGGRNTQIVGGSARDPRGRTDSIPDADE